VSSFFFLFSLPAAPAALGTGQGVLAASWRKSAISWSSRLARVGGRASWLESCPARFLGGFALSNIPDCAEPVTDQAVGSRPAMVCLVAGQFPKTPRPAQGVV
jgi:hypothetical protein